MMMGWGKEMRMMMMWRIRIMMVVVVMMARRRRDWRCRAWLTTAAVGMMKQGGVEFRIMNWKLDSDFIDDAWGCLLTRLLEQRLEVKLVRIPFPMYLAHYVLVVVVPSAKEELLIVVLQLITRSEYFQVTLIPESSWKFVIVHVWLCLPLSPSSSHFVRIRQLELPIMTVPSDAWNVGSIRKKLQ
jgi:hypothetical protein